MLWKEGWVKTTLVLIGMYVVQEIIVNSVGCTEVHCLWATKPTEKMHVCTNAMGVWLESANQLSILETHAHSLLIQVLSLNC